MPPEQHKKQKLFGPFFQKRTACLLLCAACAVFAADRVCPPNLTRLTASKEVRAADGQLLRAFPAGGGTWRLRTGVGDVDPRYLQLLLAAEDKRFRSHGGVDAGALLRAAWQYARFGRIVSGGSTLSMQTARLLEPHRRSLAGKLHDIVRAWQLEERYSKDAILSIYLTLAPFGGNVEGVRAASLAWFGHDPSQLSQAEAALLVAIPQAPARRRPDHHFATAMRAATLLVGRLRAARALPAGWSDDGTLSWQEAVPARHDLPRVAPLFCASLARTAPPGATIRSTIDFALQRRLENLLDRATAAEPPAVGVAGVIVDNATRRVRASVGGRGPGLPGADLDLTAARRSPGSALKPFIYGMAFDSGLLHPLTLIGDAPGLIPGYAPHNFDDLYHGAITAQTALRQSYNVPAVQVLQKVGPERFVAGLRQAGATVAMPGRQASLAVALGGLGISLSDMVMLYAALGDDGRAAPLVQQAGAAAYKVAFMGPLAVYYLRQVLEGSPPPPGMAYASLTGGRAIAFKTGTSYGFRDAWAVGYSQATTIGIWTGRVEGTPRPGSFGRATAAPLMLQAFGLLPPEDEPTPAPPADAILAESTAQLPPALRRLGAPEEVFLLRPVLDYPPPGATIDLTLAADSKRYMAVTLRVRGGTAPFRWIINGRPVAGQGAELRWEPDGPGAATITVIGADDLAVHGSFRMEPD
jgi:penicillin-binding protein 1C